MAKKKEDSFWVSYSDMMTSLFFVMLVLFVLVFSYMRYQHQQLQIQLEEYKKIEELKKALHNLEGEYFRYDKENKRHELIVPIKFSSGNPEIPNDPELRANLLQAGRHLKSVLQSVKIEDDVKYLLIIEGMAARYLPYSDKRNHDLGNIDETYALSYNRAKSLFYFWKKNGITFDEDIVEIQLAGSGWFGTGRFMNSDEGKNKRFLIQIIPKIGEIERH
ncbi:hypothetical protein [Labilibaculum antarcticum]|uniref:OmpA-like domain-containing protein n=1 Tax=Labilibaculum antarcticum TaxID=1717717 RepID=A0A1Y1CK85_9BACT|nr:hypothetical protein [Labilibaculum antarcticum]BAX80828.1 hypothetical protein ALGA_2506 [Labilibaculum antarcticum]